ncbi:MAG: hypothetical protein CVT49_11765 [candidate division Zixibacteria bacterium HGW-Zixibacteria-1]|nr:MAG: hypothetical protein CVT49_11765 [candidate division Zixibacteria bacterium HGW-Zixibacteria-1]
MEFPISGVETYWWLPMLVAFGISTLTSMGGVSGAFLILPFQVSILGFTGPAVSPTNLVFNIVAIPSGVYSYWHEKRMVWPLTWTIIIGTLPGVFLGAIIRIKYLPDPRAFKVFAGLVLLYIAIRLVIDFIKKKTARASAGGKFEVTPIESNLKCIGYEFNGEPYKASTMGLLALSFVVGIVGGTYGIGGGAIIAPFLIAVFGLPVYTVAGAALLGTFITSVAGVAFYAIIARFYGDTGLAISPDWLLGGMFGIGGAAGMYVGARIQKYISARVIKVILAAAMLFIAVKYISGILR